MLIALLNASRNLSDKLDKVSLIAQAVSKQLRLHAAPAWQALPWTCALYQDPNLVPRSAYRLWLLDDSDAAGALGYHDQDPQGVPYGKVFVQPILDSGGDVLSSANSVSVTVSHEALEMFGDAEVGYWAQMPDGRLIALELADPVEGDAYPITIGTTAVMVSNFVTPEYFDSNPESTRFDYMKRLKGPFEMTPGGYRIIQQGGAVSNEFGAAYPDWKRAGKTFPAARTARRSR
jgi:hypothetical protein